MTEKEIAELRRRFRADKSNISHVRGCYVNEKREIISEFDQSLAMMNQEESEELRGILRKTLSGTVGKNLLDITFDTRQVVEGDEHKLLMALRSSQLGDQEAVQTFFQRTIQSLDLEGNYLILLIHDAYDVPGRASDNLDMDDASDYVYEFILCSICPVKLDKPGLCYNVSHNTIENRVQDWVVGAPENGFLFPAFTDRNTDIHNLLYFTKNAEMDQPDFLDHFLGCQAPLSAKSQKETFQSIIEETLDSACDFSTVMTIQENLNTMIEERKDDPEPVVLDKHEVKRLLASSGVPNEQLDEFDEKYESIADEKASFVASNVASTRNYEIRTPDVIIKVSPEKAQLIETRTIDGTPYILIEAADEVEINGILLKPSRPSDADDTEF